MKKWLAFFMTVVMLMTQTGLGSASKAEEPEFKRFGDSGFLQYMEDLLYACLEGDFASDDYIVEDVSAIYVSQEYLDEVAFNTRANVYFGYTLAELNAAFEGKRYVFTCSAEGETIVQEFEEFPDDTNAQILKNIAIGTGVILFCVTVSVISGGLATTGATASAAKTISLIFAASAKTAGGMAAGGAFVSGTVTAIVKGIETGDVYETVRATELSASEGFKWGAISGAVVGGTKEALRIYSVKSRPIPTPREAEQNVYKAYHCTAEQKSFLNGQEVSQFTPNATRPDALRFIDGHWEAIEVKRYDLLSAASRAGLKKELTRQITARTANLPANMTQRVVLDVTGRGYTKEFVAETVEWVRSFLDPICPNIPIDVFGGII